jgi:uracil-DNA glycosylase
MLQARQARIVLVLVPMNTDRPTDLRTLMAFYLEAGVDVLLQDEPVDRFVAEVPRILSAVAAADAQGAPDAAGKFLGDAPSRAPLNRAGSGAGPRRSGLGDPAPLDAPPAPDAAIMAAREAAGSASSLEALRAILDRFEGCGLRVTANRLVFADGNPQAKVMFVGEAPGREEDIEGLPFVGRSGQLLDRMMGAIGLDRGSAYIANVIPWRPPGNRTPTPQESQICLPFIRRQIELADPDVLVCLGGPSAQTLLGIKEGIRRARGRWHAYHTGTREIRAIASFHPAYLLRTPLEKRFAWRDFLAIKQALAQ